MSLRYGGSENHKAGSKLVFDTSNKLGNIFHVSWCYYCTVYVFSRYGKASLWRLSALHSARYHVRMLQVLDSDTLFNLFIQNKDKRMMGS